MLIHYCIIQYNYSMLNWETILTNLKYTSMAWDDRRRKHVAINWGDCECLNNAWMRNIFHLLNIYHFIYLLWIIMYIFIDITPFDSVLAASRIFNFKFPGPDLGQIFFDFGLYFDTIIRFIIALCFSKLSFLLSPDSYDSCLSHDFLAGSASSKLLVGELI